MYRFDTNFERFSGISEASVSSKLFPLVNLRCQNYSKSFSSVIMNNSKLTMSWGRGGASSHASSDPILNRDIFSHKAKITEKKSILSRMKRLFQPKPQKPVGELPEGLKDFFEPVPRPVKSPSPVEVLSDSEYKPPTEREWNYLMTEPIFEKGYLQPPPYRQHFAAAIDPNQQTQNVNNLNVSNFKKEFEGKFERSTQAGTAEGIRPPSSRSLAGNANHIQDARISCVKDVEFFRYANTKNIQDWVEEVRRKSI